MNTKPSLLLIYTGGTIGMVRHPETGHLIPFDFKGISTLMPELQQFDLEIEAISFQEPIDSSNVTPQHWIELALLIHKHYDRYIGFVILHGSDTMAYTASALSFMLTPLSKPIIITGSQLPIGMIRNDARENLITSIEIASAYEHGVPLVPEVCIYFDSLLLRGNRSKKFNAEKFEAFQSPNYPPLAEAATRIRYNQSYIRERGRQALSLRLEMSSEIGVLKLFPGISEGFANSLLADNQMKALIVESFGSGNVPTHYWLNHLLSTLVNRGVAVVVLTQCPGGSVELGKYEVSATLVEMGCISGLDITFESCLTKLMLLLGENADIETIRVAFQQSWAGEITV